MALAEFVAPSADGTIRLCPSQDGGDCIDIPEAAVLHFEQDAASDVTELFVDLSAIVTVVATRSYPITALVTARLDDAPDAGSGTSCVEKRQKKCREDPTVSDKSFCDSEKGKAVFKILCDLFGDPALTTPGGVTDVVIV